MKKLVLIATIFLLSGCSNPNTWTYAYPYDTDCVIIKATDKDVPDIKPGIYCKVEIRHP